MLLIDIETRQSHDPPPETYVHALDVCLDVFLLFCTLVSSPPPLLLLLPTVHYSLASQLHSSICPIRPERQSGTVLPVIRPRGGPVRASRWNASRF